MGHQPVCTMFCDCGSGPACFNPFNANERTTDTTDEVDNERTTDTTDEVDNERTTDTTDEVDNERSEYNDDQLYLSLSVVLYE